MFNRKTEKQKLGENLVRAGKIRPEPFIELPEQEHRPGRPLGDIVVEGGHIAADELHTYLPRRAAKRPFLTFDERLALDQTEAYLLQTALRFTLFSDDPIKTLLVTSALPGEGKTTCAGYLARVLASVQQGRFLLVDADLANPTLHTRHGTPASPGWTDYLVNGHELDECLFPAGIGNLQVLPAGTIPPNPAAIFASKRMKEFVQELEERFDLVVFDSSPLMPVPATALLGTNLDATIMVVKAGSTSRKLVKKAIGMLNESQTKVIGVVLNQVEDTRLPRYAYKYSGYYGRSGEAK